MPDARASRDRLSQRFLIGYGMGQAGAQVCRDLPVYMLPPYLSLVLGVPAWMMGLVIFVPKLWVIFFDPMIGAMSDRTHSRIGRRRPFLLAAALTCPIALIALFSIPMFGAPWMRAVYACLLFGILTTAYSVFSVPYLSLGAEASDDSRERTRLMSYRLVFVAVGILASSGGAQALVNTLGGGRSGYQHMAIIIAIICGLAMLGCFFGVKGARGSVDGVEPLSLRDQAKLVAGNKTFRLMVSVHFVHMVAQALANAVYVIFITLATGRSEVLLYMSMANALTIIIAQPMWLAIADRIGKRASFMLACIGLSIVTISFVFVREGPRVLDLPIMGRSSWQDLGVVIRHAIVGLVMSGVTLMSLATLTDTLTDHRKETGTAREGAFVGVWSAIEKLGNSTGPLFAGPILSAFGFIQMTGGGQAVQQPASVMTGLILLYAVIPTVMFLGSVRYIARFPRK